MVEKENALKIRDKKESGAPEGKHCFGVVKVGSKGQIVIPKEARDLFEINPGDQLLMLGDESSGLALVDNGMFTEFAHQVLNAQKKVGD